MFCAARVLRALFASLDWVAARLAAAAMPLGRAAYATTTASPATADRTEPGERSPADEYG